MFAEHASWPKGQRCHHCKVEHPSAYFAYEGCRSDGSGIVGPVCGMVAQGKCEGYQGYGFFDLGRTKPWKDALFGNLDGAQ